MFDPLCRRGRVYYTRVQAQDGAREIDSFGYDQEGQENLAQDDPQDDQTPQQPNQSGDQSVVGEGRHINQFVGLLALTGQVAQSGRRLQFNPLLAPTRQRGRRPPTPPTPPTPPIIQPMAQVIENPRVKAAKFKGKAKEDADCHVAQFETKWQANGYAAIHNDQTKLEQFAATLEAKAMSWFSQYGVAHFLTYAALRASFLQ